MSSTKDAEFNPSLFKRSIFGTILYGFCAIGVIFFARKFFSTTTFGVGYLAFIVDPFQPFEKSPPQSVLASSLCYVSGFLCLLQGLLLVLMGSKPQFTMRADYRRRVPVAMVIIYVLILAAQAAFELGSIDSLLLTQEDSFRKNRKERELGHALIKSGTKLVIMGIILGIIIAGFVFWVLMLPVNSKSCMARWLRPFHIRSESNMDQVADMQPAYQATADGVGVTAPADFSTSQPVPAPPKYSFSQNPSVAGSAGRKQ